MNPTELGGLVGAFNISEGAQAVLGSVSNFFSFANPVSGNMPPPPPGNEEDENGDDEAGDVSGEGSSIDEVD
jgi:hypothetical protein